MMSVVQHLENAAALNQLGLACVCTCEPVDDVGRPTFGECCSIESAWPPAVEVVVSTGENSTVVSTGIVVWPADAAGVTSMSAASSAVFPVRSSTSTSSICTGSWFNALAMPESSIESCGTSGNASTSAK